MCLKIIIVEDDTSVRQALRLLFKAAGFDALAFASAETFIESGHYDTSDCIVTDLCMPCVTGFDLLERLQARGNTIPVIVVTSFGGPANRERARRLGAKAFFGKPIDDQALVDAVNWVIEGADALHHKAHPTTGV